MSHPCTVGCLSQIFRSTLPADQTCPKPRLQCLQVKPIAAQSDAPERFRIVLSDTVNFIQAMLATQANDIVRSGQLQKGNFVELHVFSANLVKGKRILIITELIVLPHPPADKVGAPAPLEDLPLGQGPDNAPKGMSNAPQTSAVSFYGEKKPAPAPRQAPRANASRGGATTETHANIMPIDMISPYQNRWTIKARVIYKSEIKHYQSAKAGEGKLFTVTFMDETGEIRATGFKQEVDSFYELLQEGQVYYVSNCRVNMAKKQFTNVQHDYELTFQRDTMIEACADDSIPQMRFSFVRIDDLKNVEPNAIIDVIGVIKEVADCEDIVSKTSQKPYSKRDITLVDNSNAWIRCTVWGNNAKSWDTPPGNVVAFKGVKVGDFGGRTLSMLYSSTMAVNPDIDEAHTLKGWFDGEGDRDLSTFSSHQHLASMGNAAGASNDPIKTIQEIKDEDLGTGDEVDRFQLKATVVYVRRENISYPACLTEKCNKKMTPVDEETWRCEKCDAVYPHPNYRYIMAVSVNDAWGQLLLSCFDEVGKIIMGGRTASEMHELHEKAEKEGGEYKTQEEQIFTDALCKQYLFRCTAKADNYGEQQRVRYSVRSAVPLDYASEARKLIEQINLYN